MSEKEVEIAGKLVPILREGVEMTKMLLFMKMKEALMVQEEQWPVSHRSKIIGAVLNDIFGVENLAPEFVKFSAENKADIARIIGDLPAILGDLNIILTDSLRIMVLCDHQEGVDNSMVLQQAEDKGFFLIDRDLPMPNTFIDLVRRLGGAYGLVAPPESREM